MAQNPLIKRYLDAGMAFTQMTQSRAEAIVKDLVRAGEVQTQRAEELVNALVERSRQNTERLLELVRAEVRDQITTLGLAKRADVERLERKVDAAPAAEKSPAERSTTKKSAAKKSTAKKSPAKRSTAKKSPAKKSTTKKSPAKKASKAAKKSARRPS